MPDDSEDYKRIVAAAVEIKSIQQFFFFNSGSKTINEVVMDKTILLVQNRYAGGGSAKDTQARLTSPTNIETIINNALLQATVIEFVSGVTVTHDVLTMGEFEEVHDETIDEVDVDKTFILNCGCDGYSTNDADNFATLELLDATTIRANREVKALPGELPVAYEIVEFI